MQFSANDIPYSISRTSGDERTNHKFSSEKSIDLRFVSQFGKVAEEHSAKFDWSRNGSDRRSRLKGHSGTHKNISEVKFNRNSLSMDDFEKEVLEKSA
jgi:exopolyphosphatase/pppGpp-phosphohydrolase